MNRLTMAGAIFAAGFLGAVTTLALRSPEEAPKTFSEASRQAALRNPAAPQETTSFSGWPPPLKNGGWRLVTSKTTSAAWLYSTKTGKVYRILKNCDSQDSQHGCLVPLLTIYGPQLKGDLPSPGGDDY